MLLPMAAVLKAAWGSVRLGARRKLGLIAWLATDGTNSPVPDDRKTPCEPGALTDGLTALAPGGMAGAPTGRRAWAVARGVDPSRARPASADAPNHLVGRDMTS